MFGAPDFTLLWWHWMVLGMVLCLAEIAIPAFFVIWFGIGALLTGLALWLVPGQSFAIQMLVWTLASLAMTVLWFRILRNSPSLTRSGRASAEAVGEVGLLLSAVAPYQPGQVRFQKPLLGAERWPCIADAPLSSGARVKVLAVEGNLLRVGPV